MSHHLLAIDPGKEYVGVCWFTAGVLVEGTLLAGHPQDVAQALRVLATKHGVKRPDQMEVVAERPLHRGPRERSNFNEDIVPLIEMSLYLCGVFSPAHYVAVNPVLWKGTIDPDMCLQRAFNTLDVKEQRALPVHRPKKKGWQAIDHNVLDACGIGLWRLKRMHAGLV